MTKDEILALLETLDTQTADSLESQELDFKEWPSGVREGLDKVVEMAVCMANGGGGIVVFGVRDRVVGRGAAIVGVPPHVETTQLVRAVYDRTDPRLTPGLYVLSVPEGTGRLIVMEVFPGIPPYTDVAGAAKIRVGKECKPLTGSLRQDLLAVSGNVDWSAKELNEPVEALLSPAAIDALKKLCARQGLPNETLRMSEVEFLDAIGVRRRGRLTRAGLLIVGNEEALRQHVPNHVWTYLRMTGSEVDYSLREDGRSALGLALPRLEELIRADNPAMTIKDGLHHFEYRTWPEEALREALLNAFCHRDFGLGGPVVVKHGPDLLSLSNPGGFVGGVTKENILHHSPVSRNPHLVDVLVTLRLVNRSNVGVKRMVRSLLVEGKEPPSFESTPNSVEVRFRRSDLSPPFRAFVSAETERGRDFKVEILLLLQHLMHVPHISLKVAARLMQRPESAAVSLLSSLEVASGYLARSTKGKEPAWELSEELKKRLTQSIRIRSSQGALSAADSLEQRILDSLFEAAQQGEAGLTNKQLREAFGLSRDEVLKVMKRLQEKHPRVRTTGKRGRGARFVFGDPPSKGRPE